MRKKENGLSIYTKLKKVQGELTEKSANLQQKLKLVKFTLTKYGFMMIISDDTSKDVVCETNNGISIIKYLKKLEIIDCAAVDFNILEMADKEIEPSLKTEALVFNFWAMGQGVDIAEAKIVAENYAMKCILNSFFLTEIEKK